MLSSKKSWEVLTEENEWPVSLLRSAGTLRSSLRAEVGVTSGGGLFTFDFDRIREEPKAKGKF